MVGVRKEKLGVIWEHERKDHLWPCPGGPGRLPWESHLNKMRKQDNSLGTVCKRAWDLSVVLETTKATLQTNYQTSRVKVKRPGARRSWRSRRQPGRAVPPHGLLPLLQEEQGQDCNLVIFDCHCRNILGANLCLERCVIMSQAVPWKSLISGNHAASVFLAIQNTSYLCPLSIRGFADSAQWMLSDVTPALGHAPSAHGSGLWHNVLLEVSTLRCSSSVPLSQWFSGTFLFVSPAFIEQGQRCRHSAMDDQAWWQHDFAVLPDMDADENPSYSFLKLGPNYVLHINTKYFLQFQYPLNHPIMKLQWKLGKDLLCFFLKLFPELVAISKNHMMIFETPI